METKQPTRFNLAKFRTFHDKKKYSTTGDIEYVNLEDLSRQLYINLQTGDIPSCIFIEVTLPDGKKCTYDPTKAESVYGCPNIDIDGEAAFIAETFKEGEKMKAKITSDTLVLASWAVPIKYAGKIMEGENIITRGGINSFIFKENATREFGLPLSEVEIITETVIEKEA